MRQSLLIAAIALLGLATAADASAHCSNVLPDGRIIVQGPLVDRFGRACPGTFVRPPFVQRQIPRHGFPAPSMPRQGFTTGEIGPFTTGDIGPFTTFSNSVPPAQPRMFRRR